MLLERGGPLSAGRLPAHPTSRAMAVTIKPMRNGCNNLKNGIINRCLEADLDSGEVYGGDDYTSALVAI
jgi:hypothetical protein